MNTTNQKSMVDTLTKWYQANKRDHLPWRRDHEPYHVWVSEIMLQQTRVEAVIPYYERFLAELPEVADLAACPEDRLLKLWEGLGYYSRVRNMQKAAIQIMEEHEGKFPETADELEKLCGIGSYTAGAIASIAFGQAVPAVDGNVLRVMSRVDADPEDISKQSVKKALQTRLMTMMEGAEAPGDFNQGMMDLGATICLPNGEPKCQLCPYADICKAHEGGTETNYPVKAKKKPRRIEERTILLVRDGADILIHQRPARGLLAGLYEFPNLENTLTEDQALAYVQKLGLEPIRIQKLADAKHIFSHIEWHMTGYEILLSAFGNQDGYTEEGFQLVSLDKVQKEIAIPSAFRAYADHIRLHLGKP